MAAPAQSLQQPASADGCFADLPDHPHSCAATIAGNRPEELKVVVSLREFALENRATSWWCLCSTFLALGAAILLAAVAPDRQLRVLGSLFAALLMIRSFIIYHDFMHGAILRNSRIARSIMYLFGCLVLAPPRSWRKSHSFHHAHVGEPMTADGGSFPLMSTRTWREASGGARLKYRISRHPLVILGAYLTVFAGSLTIQPLIEQPRRHWDSAVSLALHAGMIAALVWMGGWSLAFFTVLLPLSVASMVGAYLFYVQHNYPGMRILAAERWSSYRASLQSCSYFRMGRLPGWFTGNIGHHHIHHLNAAIPFYRLSAAMASTPELQHPVATSFRIRDIVACLKLKLWDEESGMMVGYPLRR
jgi:omega-6 fatty acid desaturase (delta-12 desaturase)